MIYFVCITLRWKYEKIYFTCVFPICGCFLHDEIQKERLKSVPNLPAFALRVCAGISPRPDICKATDVFLKHTLTVPWLPALEDVKACLEIMGKLSVN